MLPLLPAVGVLAVVVAVDVVVVAAVVVVVVVVVAVVIGVFCCCYFAVVVLLYCCCCCCGCPIHSPQLANHPIMSRLHQTSLTQKPSTKLQTMTVCCYSAPKKYHITGLYNYLATVRGSFGRGIQLMIIVIVHSNSNSKPVPLSFSAH